ncbi:MAG: ABC transporter ATP-binding protein [Candidatus Tectomicrobia bacterium]|nr:ABC transporter ATP-binding protein [Candidatus Tectomicrobia bacterium]
MAPLLEFSGVSQVYEAGGEFTTALENVTFTIKPQQFVTIVGPSGCGKTTLLKILAGLLAPSSGEVRYAGKAQPRPHPDFAMVFQDFRLFPWMTILANVEFGLRFHGRERSHERAQDLIKRLGLEGFERHYPYELSGGMQQRVGIARALCVEPKVLMMDEPFAALDAQTREILQREMLDLWEHDRKTVCFITHSIDEAILLGDLLIVMKARPGRIKTMLDITLPRPRWRREVKESPAFLELRSHIWELLEEEINLRRR